jgi:flagellar hook-basal body complex protein FliE
MTVESIAALQAQSQALTAAVAQPDAASTNFDNLVTEGLRAVNGKLLGTETDLQRLAVGDIRNLHQVMIDLAEAKEALQMLVQVQGRLMDAYQEVMRTQV